VAYAKQVLNSEPPSPYQPSNIPYSSPCLALTMSAGIVNQGIDVTSTDAAIQNAVNACWNAFSGAL
jgi:hypothetical protein